MKCPTFQVVKVTFGRSSTVIGKNYSGTLVARTFLWWGGGYRGGGGGLDVCS